MALDHDHNYIAAPKSGLPAWLMSGVLHCVIVLSLAFLVRVAPRGIAEPAREGGIVLVKNLDNRSEYLTEEDASSSGGSPSQASGIENIANLLPAASNIPVDLAGVLPSGNDFAGIGGDTGDALPGADGLIVGPNPSRFRGNQTQTSVFGVQGVGSKFIYVFDRSQSMSGYEGRPLASAKAELIASLESLQSTHQFQIVFYNQKPLVFNPFPDRTPQMMFGNDRDKELAMEFVRKVVADGSTHHIDALKLAVGLGPDVVFFLTDAEEPRLNEGELAMIRRWNQAEASINTIEFGGGPFRGGDNFLAKLARENNGRHVYVDVTRLPDRR